MRSWRACWSRARPRPALRLRNRPASLSRAGICAAVFPNPIMPGLTDGERQLDRLAKAARDAGALIVRRRAAVPDALGAEGVPAVSGEAFSGTGAALSRACIAERHHLGRAYKEMLAHASGGFATGTAWLPGRSNIVQNCGRVKSRGRCFR